jgi:organic hydroperoxide reductase OsmC/OhrA
MCRHDRVCYERRMTSTHRYQVRCSWEGSTGLGYEGYDRSHAAVTVPPTAEVALSADPAFRGDPTLLNPEQLVVLAAASCQLLSFLAVAARARVDVVAYDDDAEGFMPEDDLPMRLARIELRPTITVAADVPEERIRRLVDLAHRECYIANSLRTEITVTPTIIPAPHPT